jgi:hypothetical protein
MVLGVGSKNGAAQNGPGIGRRPNAYSTLPGKCFCVNVE